MEIPAEDVTRARLDSDVALEAWWPVNEPLIRCPFCQTVSLARTPDAGGAWCLHCDTGGGALAIASAAAADPAAGLAQLRALFPGADDLPRRVAAAHRAAAMLAHRARGWLAEAPSVQRLVEGLGLTASLHDTHVVGYIPDDDTMTADALGFAPTDPSRWRKSGERSVSAGALDDAGLLMLTPEGRAVLRHRGCLVLFRQDEGHAFTLNATGWHLADGRTVPPIDSLIDRPHSWLIGSDTAIDKAHREAQLNEARLARRDARVLVLTDHLLLYLAGVARDVPIVALPRPALTRPQAARLPAYGPEARKRRVVCALTTGIASLIEDACVLVAREYQPVLPEPMPADATCTEWTALPDGPARFVSASIGPTQPAIDALPMWLQRMGWSSADVAATTAYLFAAFAESVPAEQRLPRGRAAAARTGLPAYITGALLHDRPAIRQ